MLLSHTCANEFQISNLHERFQIRDPCVKKIDEGREKRTANTLRGTLHLRMATLTRFANERRRHPLKAPCLHLSQIGTSIVKKLKERALSLPGKLPAPSILRDFALRFGSGRPLPLINASFDGYLWTLPVFVRVRRQKYWSLTRSGLRNRRPYTWPRTAAISSNVLCLSWSSTLKFSSSQCAISRSRELSCIKYQ